MINQIYLKYNVTKQSWTYADGTIREIKVVNKDTALFAIQFVESRGASETALNLVGITAGRLVCDAELSEAATLLFFQDQYNQGEDLAYEDLANGLMTHVINFNTTEINDHLGAEKSVAAVMEYSVLDAAGRPQTLTPGGIPISIISGVDQGAEGTPAPVSPTYYTASEVNGLIPVPKLDATAPPTVNDDSDDGYSIGSRWTDIANNKLYFAVDVTVGAAVWVQAGLSAADVKSLYESNADTNNFSDALKTKLDAIETGATADQTGAQIKAAYEAELNAFTDALFTKLAGIEASAKDDQTGAEIQSLYEALSDVNRFTDALLSKLNGIEAAATADQTDTEIQSLYEGLADVNRFTNALKTKLDAIETGATADQTDAEIKTGYDNEVPIATQGEAEGGSGTTARRWTPQRIAQAIAALGAGGGLQNKYDATVAPGATDDTGAGYSVGSVWIDVTNDESYRCVDNTAAAAVWIKTSLETTDLATVALSGDSDDLTEGATKLLMTSAERTKLGTAESNAKDDQTDTEIQSLYEGLADVNRFTDALLSKLNGIETGATADQTGAQIKAAYEAELNAFTDALFTKLAGIEASATADQTGAEIQSLYEALSDVNRFTDALKTKLDAIETGATADQTDAQIEAGYNNQVAIASQAEAEAGTVTSVRRFTPQRVKQAIDALAGGGGAWEEITSATASSSSSIEFTGLSSEYKMYKVLITGLEPGTDASGFWLRTSANNGSSYDSGGSDYKWTTMRNYDSSETGVTDLLDAQIKLTGDFSLGSASNEDSNFIIEVFNPSDTSRYTAIQWRGTYTTFAPDWVNADGGAERLSVAKIDGIQFLMSSGNISKGTFTLYGLK